MEKYELPKRATRGLRMNALVGKAQEEDDLFYMGVFGEAEQSDDDFGSKDASEAHDSFDSDFGNSSKDDEARGDQEEGEEELNLLKRERKDRRKKVRFAQRKKIKRANDTVTEARADEVDRRRSRRIGEKGDAEVVPVVKKVFKDGIRKKSQKP